MAARACGTAVVVAVVVAYRPVADWQPYRKCPICEAPAGTPCVSRSARVVDGRPDGVVTLLATPHIARTRRT